MWRIFLISAGLVAVVVAGYNPEALIGRSSNDPGAYEVVALVAE